MAKKCVLVIGGVGSGKSHLAQELAQRWGGPVLFVATAEAGDEEMRRRIEAHRRHRTPGWKTLEVTGDIGANMLNEAGPYHTVIVDCITLLLSNILNRYDTGSPGADAIEPAVDREVNGLIEAYKSLEASLIIVSNEVGMGVVPATPLGRVYRDLLARANRLLAAAADEVYMMVAGLPIAIKGEGSPGES